MKQLIARPTRPEDVAMVAYNLRRSDVDEIVSRTGADPYDALWYTHLASEFCTVGVDPETDVPEVMFGVVPHPNLPGVGYIWLVGTDALVTTYKKTFVQQTLKYFREVESQYDVLLNWIDSRQSVHIEWIQKLGFKFIDTSTTVSVDGTRFYKFIKITNRGLKECA